MNSMDILLESIDLLLNEAAETDDSTKAAEYIEKAQELQAKALNILADDDDKDEAKDEKKADDKKDEKTKEDVVIETIDNLLNLAAMTESACEADSYIKAATELQKSIDDIPEEEPVVDDEYPTDITDKYEDPDDLLDDIKDIIGDDEKALKLLTTDPDSLTIG